MLFPLLLMMLIMILKIHLSQTMTSDRLVKLYQGWKIFTSSGYWFLRHNPDFEKVGPSYPHGDPLFKAKIWRLNIMPKLKKIQWCILSKAVSTATGLKTRGLNMDSICQRCGLNDETLVSLSVHMSRIHMHLEIVKNYLFTIFNGSWKFVGLYGITFKDTKPIFTFHVR